MSQEDRMYEQYSKKQSSNRMSVWACLITLVVMVIGLWMACGHHV